MPVSSTILNGSDAHSTPCVRIPFFDRNDNTLALHGVIKMILVSP